MALDILKAIAFGRVHGTGAKGTEWVVITSQGQPERPPLKIFLLGSFLL